MALNLEEVFEKHNDEFLEFERIETKRHPAPDIHAFLLLYEIAPPECPRDIVCGAGHDEIYLDTDPEELAEKATEEQIVELIRCGVRFDSDGCLCMFV